MNKSVIGILVVLCILHGLDWLEARFTNTSLPVKAEVKTDLRVLIGGSPRIASLARYWKNKSQTYKHGRAEHYLIKMQQSVVSDYHDARFYLTLGEQGMAVQAGQYFYRDKWTVTYDDDQQELVASFGEDSVLVMNLEMIKYPNCKADEHPIVMYLTLTDKDTPLPFVPVTMVENELGWRVKMNVVDEYDMTNLQRRLLVKRGCLGEDS
jgi:hypothetical protein